jgi:hypothetical protein
MDTQSIWNLFSQSEKETAQTDELRSNLGEMQTWMRNLEQHLMSVNARLGAVEQRISDSGDAQPDVYTSDSLQSTVNPSSVVLMNEITKDQLQRFEKQLNSFSEKINQLDAKEKSNAKFNQQTKQELKKLSAKKDIHPVVMKIGKKEIPLELSGVIGGFICFLVAGLAAVEATEIVLSPWFLTGIGFVLIGGAFVRSELQKPICKKISKIVFPQSQDSRVHHSDSTS